MLRHLPRYFPSLSILFSRLCCPFSFPFPFKNLLPAQMKSFFSGLERGRTYGTVRTILQRARTAEPMRDTLWEWRWMIEMMRRERKEKMVSPIQSSSVEFYAFYSRNIFILFFKLFSLLSLLFILQLTTVPFITFFCADFSGF